VGISDVQNAPDPRLVLPTLGVSTLPYWVGVTVFIGVLGASMSTANGATLVISVVLARNMIQRWRAVEISDSRMLLLSRVMAVPTAAAAGPVAYFRPEPGILLVVAFDIVFAGCVVPLFLGVYWSKANSAGRHCLHRRGNAVTPDRTLYDAASVGRPGHPDAPGFERHRIRHDVPVDMAAPA
jgi:Na+/proline symporter